MLQYGFNDDFCGPGGVASIYLMECRFAPAPEVDPEDGSCSLPGAAAAGRLTEFSAEEDSASYTETALETPHGMSVTHRLEFRIADLSPASRRALGEILSSPSGVVALVELRGGSRLLAGWSERFGFTRPLRPAAVTSASGSTPGQRAGRTIILESVDTEAARNVKSL